MHHRPSTHCRPLSTHQRLSLCTCLCVCVHVLGAQVEVWEAGSIDEMRGKHKNLTERVVPHAQTICDRTVNFYR